MGRGGGDWEVVAGGGIPTPEARVGGKGTTGENDRKAAGQGEEVPGQKTNNSTKHTQATCSVSEAGSGGRELAPSPRKCFTALEIVDIQ